MRENLFRGKRKDNGEWVYGYLIICDKRYFILKSNEFECFYFSWLKDNEYIFGRFVEVIPETVGQYTGLTDKNVKKIFEGDILKGSWETVLTIFYDKISSSYRVKTSTGHEREPSYYGIEKWKIIGNIHDNPELLKVGEE